MHSYESLSVGLHLASGDKVRVVNVKQTMNVIFFLIIRLNEIVIIHYAVYWKRASNLALDIILNKSFLRCYVCESEKLIRDNPSKV